MNLPTKNIPRAATSTEALLANIANTLAQSQVASKHLEITPSNTDRYTNIKALYVGGEGDLVIEDGNGTELTYTGVQGWFLFSPAIIKETTTATNIIAVYY